MTSYKLISTEIAVKLGPRLLPKTGASAHCYPRFDDTGPCRYRVKALFSDFQRELGRRSVLVTCARFLVDPVSPIHFQN